MGSEILVVAIIFGTIFGVFYLFISSRNRERLALIEKGADASIFAKGKQHVAPLWQILVVNVALLLIGIGLGIFLASILEHGLGVDGDIARPGAIFLMAGVGLFTGFIANRKLNKQD